MSKPSDRLMGVGNEFYSKYRIVKQIGSGSYGQVFLVTDENSEVWVLKKINFGSMADREKASSLQEVNILKMLNHPNIIGYKDYYEDMQAKVLNIVMEYADSGDLYALLKNRNGKHLEESEICLYFAQILLGLREVHSHNILHRILSTGSLASTMIGTPYYLSPELCRDEPYHQASDIWSLGCILYELASLKQAFRANSLPALVLKILKGKFQPIPDHYSDELKDLVAAILKIDPNERPTLSEILKHPFMTKASANIVSENSKHFQTMKKEKKSPQSTPTKPTEKKPTEHDEGWFAENMMILNEIQRDLHPTMEMGTLEKEQMRKKRKEIKQQKEALRIQELNAKAREVIEQNAILAQKEAEEKKKNKNLHKKEREEHLKNYLLEGQDEKKAKKKFLLERKEAKAQEEAERKQRIKNHQRKLSKAESRIKVPKKKRKKGEPSFTIVGFDDQSSKNSNDEQESLPTVKISKRPKSTKHRSSVSSTPSSSSSTPSSAHSTPSKTKKKGTPSTPVQQLSERQLKRKSERAKFKAFLAKKGVKKNTPEIQIVI